ncbi:hypothetical protein LCGC14_1726320, partial [marine sediment metagenome]
NEKKALYVWNIPIRNLIFDNEFR